MLLRWLLWYFIVAFTLQEVKRAMAMEIGGFYAVYNDCYQIANFDGKLQSIISSSFLNLFGRIKSLNILNWMC